MTDVLGAALDPTAASLKGANAESARFRAGTLDEDEFSFAVWPKAGPDDDARTFRALTPSEAAERRARDDYDGTSGWRIAYRVQNKGTGKLYDVRVGVVPQPMLVAIDTREIAMQPATHVLWGGRVLCGDLRLRGVPRDWPDSQRWTSLKDVADGAVSPPDPCAACWTKVLPLVEQLRQIGEG